MKKSNIWEKKFSNNYEPGVFARFVKKYETYRSEQISKLLPKKGEILVDLACGDGDFLLKHRKRFKSLIGFDIASNRIKQARTQVDSTDRKRFSFKVADLDQGIPLTDESADVIVCEASIGCFYDVDFFLNEVNRVLSINGVFILESPNYAYLPRRLSLVLGKLPKCSAFGGFGDGGLLHYFTFSVMKELLKSHNFEIESTTNSGLLAQIRKVWPELLAGDMIIKAKKQKL